MARHTSLGNHRNAKRYIAILPLLEWAFSTEHARLSLAQDGEVILGRAYGRGSAQRLVDICQVGGFVDGGGSSDAAHDAEIVASTLSKLPMIHGGPFMAIRIADHARRGDLPNWMPGRPRIVPVDVDGRGMARTKSAGAVWETKTWTDRKGRKRSRRIERQLWFCPVVVDPTQKAIDRARAFYVDWYMAVRWLRFRLIENGQLEKHELTEDLPQGAPWEGRG